MHKIKKEIDETEANIEEIPTRSVEDIISNINEIAKENFPQNLIIGFLTKKMTHCDIRRLSHPGNMPSTNHSLLSHCPPRGNSEKATHI